MKTNPNLLTYFLSRSLFLGGGLSIIFTLSGKDAYIAAFLGILLGIIFLYILSKTASKVKVPLKEYLKEKNFLNILIKIIYLSYIIFLTLISLIILSTFIYSYFLPFTPSLISCLPFIFLAVYLNSKNIKNIYYVGLILFVISLAIIILKTTLLVNEFEINNILPILTTKPTSIFKGALIYATLSTAPYLLLIGEKINFKESLKYYLISGIVNFIVIFTIILILGEMVNVYSYPEYSVLRKIRLLDFIENIENFLCIGWFFDIFISLSLVGLKTKEIFNTKKRIIPFSIAFIILWLIYKNISDNFYNSMIIYKLFPYIFIIFLILLITLFFIKRKTSSK